MIEAMRQGEDLYRMTAAKIFEVSEAEVSKEQRQLAKAVNFGLIYGMSPFGGSRKGLPRIKNMEQQSSEPSLSSIRRSRGCISTSSKDASVNSKESELAGNQNSGEQSQTLAKQAGCQFQGWCSTTQHTLQSTGAEELAADGMKAALMVLLKRLEKLDAGLVALIHDEVIVQNPPALADKVRVTLEQAMIDGMQTFVSSVPITAEVAVGKSWAER